MIKHEQNSVSKKSLNLPQILTFPSFSSSDLSKTTSEHICNRCNKEFTRKDNLARHELTCNKNNKINYIQENEILKETVQKQSEKLEKQSEEIKEVKSMLMDLMNKNCKVHPKTLQKINKQLNNNGTLKE
jgi:uncharacterized Zn-finger protein